MLQFWLKWLLPGLSPLPPVFYCETVCLYVHTAHTATGAWSVWALSCLTHCWAAGLHSSAWVWFTWQLNGARSNVKKPDPALSRSQTYLPFLSSGMCAHVRLCKNRGPAVKPSYSCSKCSVKINSKWWLFNSILIFKISLDKCSSELFNLAVCVRMDYQTTALPKGYVYLDS